MIKTIPRYFIDFVDGQEQWLNKMAQKGYRLKKCGKLLYTFESCNPGEYEYLVDFIIDKSYLQSKDYQQYLESMHLRTFAKNINLSFSFGKAKWRPYVKGKGQIATSPGNFNKELLIVEKKNDGKAFALYTDLKDKLSSYRSIRNSYIWALICIFSLVAATFMPSAVNTVSSYFIYGGRIVFSFLGILFTTFIIRYYLLIRRIKEENKTNE